MRLPNFVARLFTPETPPPGRQDVAGFVVTDRQSGHVVHSEAFDAWKHSDDRVANKMFAKRERLEARYDPAKYDVQAGLFSSARAFEARYPDAFKK